MIAQSNYENFFKFIIKGVEENQKLLNYIKTIIPEKANDEEYIEKIAKNVYEIYTESDLEIDMLWIADNYVNILREMEIF